MGKIFQKFLKLNKELETRPYLKELAEYCYAWRQVYCQIAVPGMYLSFQYPVYEIWEQCQPEYKNTEVLPNFTEDFTEMLGRHDYLLYREENKVKILKIINEK